VNGVVFSGVSEAGDLTPLDGFAMRYLTAYNNGLYGLYAFQAANGVIEHSYASGHPDSGIYVGQCGRPAGEGTELVPCNVVVRDVVAERNAVGYEGTNASQVWLIESEFRDNRVVFFVQRLARGNHSVSYRMRAEIPGKFSALPTKAWAMYAPELKANSDEIKLRVGD
jgi:hypothetical protein